MNILPIISNSKSDLISIFKKLHQNPELGFEEFETAKLIKQKLLEYGVDEITTELGKTGIVAIINGKQRGIKQIGLRADMDALPIEESTQLDYSSKNSGIMHACGHDGHTTMLLGAAKHLSETRNFKGRVVLIFQPAEEGLGEQDLCSKKVCSKNFHAAKFMEYIIHLMETTVRFLFVKESHGWWPPFLI